MVFLSFCCVISALTAYTYLTIFDLFSLITCLISSWVSMKKPSQVYSFGFDRLEVLAVFASTVLIQLGAFVHPEGERFMEQPEVHTGRLLVGTFVALFFNLLTLLSVRNKPFTYVSEGTAEPSAPSYSLCGIVPGLSSVLLPRMNPFVLINMAGALSLCITYMLIEINDYNAVDTASAVAIALMTFGTMYPMSVYSGKVLLQTTPSHVIGQLDKLLREVSTLEGVLEVRNEHFWTVGFGSLAGSAHVRIRRDANEQLVLAHVTNRLLPLVSTLTVQIFKDDWTQTLVTGNHVLLLLCSPIRFPRDTPMDPLTSTPLQTQNAQPVVLPAPGQHSHRPYGGGPGLPYGASPYAGMLSQGMARPAGGLGLGPQALGAGFGLGAGGGPSPQSYRTAYAGPAPPLRFGTSNPLVPQAQYRQYRP
uniref:Cation efflux protein transmembrane domain-containing protein n=1 Tax=Gasterosteus aculeatus aculeatus TaxID=481459 RepID=A0AAQ4Q2E2_GASAC